MPVRVQVLGSVAAIDEGRSIAVGGPRQRQVLASLALSVGAPLSTDRLIDLVWGETPPRTARRTVQSYVASLRTALGPDTIRSTDRGYVLDLPRSAVDLLAYEDEVTSALELAESDPGAATTVLEGAVGSWAPPLGDGARSEEMAAVLVPFAELHQQATEELLAGWIARGDAAPAVRRLERLVRESPTRERLWLLLAQGLARMGHRNRALDAVQRAREVLRVELGIEIGRALADYESALLGAQDESTAATHAAPVATTGLPRPDDSLIGRDDLVGSSTELLAGSGFVSLVGVGGVGKTRLAIDVAAAASPRFPDGVWFCELASVREPDSVPSAVADAVGARPHPATSLTDSIVGFCSGRRALIVLDNCEHVSESAADLASRLRRAAPTVALLVTSREPLQVTGERVVPVPPLDVEGRSSPAVELFVARADVVQPGSSRTDADIAIIERLCRRLDGLPLAIELAASRTRSLTLADLDARLDPAFSSLRGGRRDVERHRTLQTAIEWSSEMLDDAQRLLFERLAVFAGGCDLDAAEAVCAGDGIAPAEILGLLDELVTKSLVVADTSGEHTRYRLYEPIRQFAEHELGRRGELPVVRRRHLDHFTEWAERWSMTCWGSEVAWQHALSDEWANLRAALQLACDITDVDAAARIVSSGRWALQAYGRLEFGDWGARVLALDGIDEHPLGPVVAALTASAFFWRGDDEAMRRALARGEEMKPEFDSGIEAHLSWLRGDDERAMAIQNSLAESDEPADRVVAVWQLGMYQAVARTPDSLESATRHAAALRADPVVSRSELIVSMADQIESVVEFTRGNVASSASLARAAITAARRVGSRYFAHISLPTLAVAAAVAGEVRATDLQEFASSLREQRDGRQVTDQWLTLMGVMWAISVFDRPELVRIIYAGLTRSPWAHHPGLIGASKTLEIDHGELTDDAPVLELDSLVDAALVEIDSLVDELADR